MEIVTALPFPVTTIVHQTAGGSPQLVVVVKATFAMKRGAIVRAEEQLPILLADEPYPERTTSRLESDMAPFKPRTDVVLVGRAHAPNGDPVTHLVAMVRVGTVRRAIMVFGDRRWEYRGLGPPVISKPKAFTTMDLVYERAFGGIDGPAARYCAQNLAGVGMIGKNSRESVHGTPLPNLEDPDNLIHRWDTHPKPVGFAFYGRGWQPRLGYAGTYDETYQKDVAPAMPRDFSNAFFNGAHPDLQIDPYLRGDEEVELINVSRHSPLHLRLPGFKPTVRVGRWATDPERWLDTPAGDTQAQPPIEEETITMHLDTLVFLPDEGVFYEVFRGSCALALLDVAEIATVTVTE